jgi:hypothetical protein
LLGSSVLTKAGIFSTYVKIPANDAPVFPFNFNLIPEALTTIRFTAK